MFVSMCVVHECVARVNRQPDPRGKKLANPHAARNLRRTKPATMTTNNETHKCHARRTRACSNLSPNMSKCRSPRRFDAMSNWPPNSKSHTVERVNPLLEKHVRSQLQPPKRTTEPRMFERFAPRNVHMTSVAIVALPARTATPSPAVSNQRYPSRAEARKGRMLQRAPPPHHTNGHDQTTEPNIVRNVWSSMVMSDILAQHVETPLVQSN